MKRPGILLAIVLGLATVGSGVYYYFYGRLPSGRSTNRNPDPSTSLRMLVAAEEDFRRNDRDGNRLGDYWVGDVAGLYCLMEHPPSVIKLIEPFVAARDAQPISKDRGKRRFGSIPMESVNAWKSKWRVAVIPLRWNGEPYGKDLDEDGHPDESDAGFAFCAFPISYGPELRETFIVNESGRVWKKDLGGAPVRRFPANPETEGWMLVTD